VMIFVIENKKNSKPVLLESNTGLGAVIAVISKALR